MSTEVQKGENFDYAKDVVNPWNEASEVFKEACSKANKTIPEQVISWSSIRTKKFDIQSINVQTDGVGTKVEIYCKAFNFLYSDYKDWKIKEDLFKKDAIEIWRRMFLDLYAMNADDLRNWEVCVAMTNILEIDSLSWKRGSIFVETFSQGIYKAIQDTEIPMIAGETAIIWNGFKLDWVFGECERLVESIREKIKSTSKRWWKIETVLSDFEEKIKEVKELIEIKSIWGSSQWAEVKISKKWKKVSNKIKSGQVIIWFSEKPTEDWILSPRSNGISTIRKVMKSLAGDRWENMIFEEFLEGIWDKKTAKIPDNLKKSCKGLKMWDIATGRTTVFNPFISKELLWWFQSKPKAWVSALIHVTGWPVHKIVGALGENKKNLQINLDVSKLEIPQIIQLIQILWDKGDNEALDSFNMGVPYAVVCDSNKEDIQKIIKSAEDNWIKAQIVWEVTKAEKNKKPIHRIHWVWVGKSNLAFDKSGKSVKTDLFRGEE